jgi:hypothetical protein
MPSFLSIPASNVQSLLTAGYTHIEVWLSEDDGDTWREITSNVAEHAEVLSTTARNSFALGGLSLYVKMDGGGEQEIFFDPILAYWTPDQAAARINQVLLGAAVSLDQTVILSSPATGRAGTIEIVSSPAGFFTNGAGAAGADARIPLSADSVLYPYYDVAAVASNARYRWRFSADGLSPFSKFSPWVPPAAPAADPSKISIGYMTFLGLDGSAAKGRLIIAEDHPEMLGGAAVYSSQPLLYEADETGFVQAPLLRGAHVRVGIESSTLIRSITVPDAASFDIMQALSTATDMFTVQTVPPLLTRRSL